jgi:alanyl aminopeptidase
MTGMGCSAERLAATTAFFRDPQRAIPGVEQTLSRVSDGVNTCLSLREREGERVNRYMRGFTIN